MITEKNIIKCVHDITGTDPATVENVVNTAIDVFNMYLMNCYKIKIRELGIFSTRYRKGRYSNNGNSLQYYDDPHYTVFIDTDSVMENSIDNFSKKYKEKDIVELLKKELEEIERTEHEQR